MSGQDATAGRGVSATSRQSVHDRRTADRRGPIVPPQHGAWAFLGLPVVLGWAVAGLSAVELMLGVGFVVAYPASYFAIAYLRYPRRERYVRGLVVWGSLGLLIAIAALAARPWLIWVGLAYLVAFAVNLTFAKAHNERSLINDAVFITECVAITPILWAVSVSSGGMVPPVPGSAPSVLWLVTAYAAMALVGSTMHVRSLIRARNDKSFRLASQGFAFASLLVAVGLALAYGPTTAAAAGIAFGYLWIRSIAIGRRPMKPGIIGVFELIGFLLVAGAGLIACAT